MKILTFFIALVLSASLSAQDLVMIISPPHVDGSQLTYDVRAENFTEMIGMQNAIVYDPSKLTFASLQGFNLPGLDEHDFNPNVPGEIKNVWIETSLNGVNLEAGELVYQIVFTLNGTEPGDVCFSENPISFEFIMEGGSLTSFLIQDDCHSEPFLIQLTVSMEELKEQYGISVLSHLNEGALILQCDREITARVQLFDLAGKLVWSSRPSNFATGDHRLAINKSLNTGVYVLSILVDDKIASIKVLKE